MRAVYRLFLEAFSSRGCEGGGQEVLWQPQAVASSQLWNGWKRPTAYPNLNQWEQHVAPLLTCIWVRATATGSGRHRKSKWRGRMGGDLVGDMAGDIILKGCTVQGLSWGDCGLWRTHREAVRGGEQWRKLRSKEQQKETITHWPQPPSSPSASQKKLGRIGHNTHWKQGVLRLGRR